MQITKIGCEGHDLDYARLPSAPERAPKVAVDGFQRSLAGLECCQAIDHRLFELGPQVPFLMYEYSRLAISGCRGLLFHDRNPGLGIGLWGLVAGDERVIAG